MLMPISKHQAGERVKMNVLTPKDHGKSRKSCSQIRQNTEEYMKGAYDMTNAVRLMMRGCCRSSCNADTIALYRAIGKFDRNAIGAISVVLKIWHSPDALFPTAFGVPGWDGRISPPGDLIDSIDVSLPKTHDCPCGNEEAMQRSDE